MTGLAAGTVIARNYLAHARVLAESFRRHHPEVPFFIGLIDSPAGYFDPAREPAHVFEIPAAALRRGSVKQVGAAAKPYLLQRLLDEGFTSALFLDPDMLVLGELTSLLEATREHSILLTPHFLTPPAEDTVERELNILLSGVFNAGVVGVSATTEGRSFLRWWSDRVMARCEKDLAGGLYFDQRWLDLAPVFFNDLAVFRDERFNVGHWNLGERDVQRCLLFHFSGFDPRTPELVSRFAPERSLQPDAAALFARYAELLRAAGFDETCTWPVGLAA